MSQLSVCYEGKVLDWKFIKQAEGLVAFYLSNFLDGDILIGQIWKLDTGYTAVSHLQERTKHVYPVDGFKTRWKAAEFLLKDSKFYPREG